MAVSARSHYIFDPLLLCNPLPKKEVIRDVLRAEYRSFPRARFLITMSRRVHPWREKMKRLCAPSARQIIIIVESLPPPSRFYIQNDSIV